MGIVLCDETVIQQRIENRSQRFEARTGVNELLGFRGVRALPELKWSSRAKARLLSHFGRQFPSVAPNSSSEGNSDGRNGSPPSLNIWAKNMVSEIMGDVWRAQKGVKPGERVLNPVLQERQRRRRAARLPRQ